MSIESTDDWRGLREVGRITRLTLEALQRNVRPGVTTGELDDIAATVCAKHGARSAPAIAYGFPRTVLISVNDEVVHGIPGPRRLEHGDLVKLDVTLEKHGYVADAARSVVVGTGADLAHRLVECAQEAFHAALRVVGPGVPVNEIGRAVSREVRRCGFSIVRGLTGHGVGRAIHEPPEIANEYQPWQRDVLTNGLVLTIEPMISAGSRQPVHDPDGWTIRTKDGSWASHYEETLVVTSSGPVVLTAA
jgi:methionyl aminopeptidase